MQDHAALAAAINARMDEHGFTQRDLAERSGVSLATLQRIRTAQPQRRSATTLAALSRALGWPDSYLRAVLYGEQADGADPAVAELRAGLAELTQRVEALETHMSQ